MKYEPIEPENIITKMQSKIKKYKEQLIFVVIYLIACIIVVAGLYYY